MIEIKLKKSHILIIDDQQANIDLLESFLEMQCYVNIKTTTDPRRVVQMVVDFEPDLILLDLTMPYLTGFEVMEQLKSLPTIKTFLPILVLTADTTSETKRRALSCGASDFLTKPFDLVEVGMRIRNLLFTGHLMQQLENQNQILEDKVKERTVELEKTNIDLIVALDKAEASDRLKTAFLQTISHEIRTPLNGILGFAALLADIDTSTEEKEEYIDLMQTSSDRLINTITDYVDMSMIVSGNLAANFFAVNVYNLLNELTGKYQQLCDSKGLMISLVFPDDLTGFTLMTDPVLLQKMVAHLLDNAIKFTMEGTVTIGFSMNSGCANFSVQDTGVGIDEENQKIIFEKFMQENITVTRNFEGSGLGLSIIHGILQLIGGEIHLESVKGEGALFYISLPLEPQVTE